MKVKICSIEELEKFVKELLEKWYKKFLLEWDLWVGKTEFTKQLAKQLWIKNISSPTYTYINIYEDKLLHWDFYRIENEQKFLNLWLVDEIENYNYVSIEWPKFSNYYDDWEFLKISIKKEWDCRIFYYTE